MAETLSQQKELNIKDYAKDDHVEIGTGTVHPVMKVYGDSEQIEYTAEENKRVKRKIDFVLLPLMCTCYIFSFLDKSLLNYASIFGIKEALHLEGSNYSWLGSIFYFGYMLGSVVWSKLVHRWPGHAGKFISGAVCVWSIIVLLTPLCFNFSGIMVVRFFLGFMESIIGAVFVIVTSNWWTRPEQAFRTAFWLGGTPIGNFLGGILSYAVGSIHGSIPTWKIFFLFFGSFSFVFSLILMYFMPDHQGNAKWLNEREKKIAIERVRENQTVTSDDRWKWPQFWEALRDPQTTLFFVTAMGNTMPSTFASQFSSQIVKGFGFTTLQTTIISTCPAAVIQLGTFLGLSYLASRRNNIRLYLSILVSVPPLIGASLLHVLPTSNQAGRLAGYYLTYTHSMSFTLNTGLMASNYAGNTKKSTTSGIIFAGWAAGLIAGPQFFLEREAPTYDMAFKMLMGCYALMIVIPVFQLTWYKYENNRRQRLVEARNVPTVNSVPEFTDKTDFEQWETFRYTM
ncbi:major facilitator superfamily domain-containing protein [Ilyonectria robusta]|uniref:major facilitator superfamily domain-containing protein n=1 Tax=Ilyonectria robusta TaxID=1079257 RepID=UPI001E8ED184|nr:major facilitator superfamily domain-containing protein [Ilyonectria robusta]KAH8665598.1 major facilitator superfamily domain-containing protein [Ilyonectria robusta]